MTTSLRTDHPVHAEETGRDLRRTWRILAAVSIVLGPLLVTLLRAVMPYWTDEGQAEIVASFAEAPGRGELMNYLALASYPFLLGGALATGYACRRRVPMLATVGSLILFGSLAMASYVGSADVIVQAMLATGDYDQAAIVEISTLLMEHPTGLIGILFFVFGHLTGMILLGIAVVRARLVPWWVGALIVASQSVHVISAVLVPSRALDVIGGWGATTVGFVFVALAVLRMSDDEWDAAPGPRAS